ncbi:MAG: site-specific integrase [Lewinellaceae bacterium]|nr:site-specific integrase [Lewinellaceae bacterium]
MAKKNFSPTFLPPRLVRGKSRWYIAVYVKDSATGSLVRERPTFDLNRIPNLVERAARGEVIRKKMFWWLSQGYAFADFDESKVPGLELAAVPQQRDKKQETPLQEAIEFVRSLKMLSSRKGTVKTYRSVCNLFIDFLRSRSWLSVPVGDFTTAQAMEYMDHCLMVRKLGNTAYNNTRRFMGTVFRELVQRGYVDANPFEGISKRKQEAKRRRPFTEEEGRVVAAAIRREYPVLFYGMLLQYACFVRPSEMRGLRFRDVDPAEGVVVVSAEIEKTWREKVCTIPDAFLHYFREPFWSQYPGHYFIFGEGLRPHPSKPCGASTMNSKQHRILAQLKKSGALGDITGLSWYSWKDTGITQALYEVDPSSVQDQANHADISMTMRYKKKRARNEGMRRFKNRLE